MEILSEHMCQGWLEGYLLTGRHGFFNCYEAFIHIIDSMANQHAKWLKVTAGFPGANRLRLSIIYCRRWLAAGPQRLQPPDPGFIDHLVNKKAEVVRVYLPPDANTAALGGRPLPAQQELHQPDCRRQAARAAVAHHRRGRGSLHNRLGVWKWASNDAGSPDVVMACSGDVPTRRRWQP